MKKYFAKFLPVEGEVKEGDVSFWEQREGYYAGKFFKVDSGNIAHAQVSGWKKYKLMLCSRDIKIGDEVYAEPQALNGLKFRIIEFKGYWQKDTQETTYNVILEYIQHPTKPDLIGKHYEWQPEACWKTVGEVSPNATWVVDNQEFDESDVAIYEMKGLKERGEELMKSDNYLDQIKGKAMMSVIEPKCIKDNKGKTIVTIKCPTCKSFH